MKKELRRWELNKINGYRNNVAEYRQAKWLINLTPKKTKQLLDPNKKIPMTDNKTIHRTLPTDSGR